jgi:hypothetical protein
MFFKICRILCGVWSSLLALTPVVAAQQTHSGAAPVPSSLLHAHTVFVSNRGGSNYFQTFSGGPNRAYNTFYRDLKRTGCYELVSSPEQADLIFEIRAIAPAVSGYNDSGPYNPQVVLTIRDPRTSTVIWTERANIRAFGTRPRRDRQFDQSVAVLVDKLAVVTGQPLHQAQTKAIAANSKMATTTKVFLFSAIAGSAALTASGIHAMMNRPALNPPPMPTLP